ncbi:MAG: TRAP transporter small permease subunit [Pseudomonadales bacterium]|nr:TRAP transporter small permease subunit [Pseudomonadales bacterium]
MLKKILSTIDAFTEHCGNAIAWLTLVMMLVMFTSVVLRYLFQIGFTALDESVIYMHSMVFMLGAAFTLKRGGHVRVDIFYNQLSAIGKARVDIIGTCFLLLPVCLFIGVVSWEYVAASWQILESSAQVGGIPAVFLLKSLILLMSALLTLQAIAELIRNGLILSGCGQAGIDSPKETIGL